MQPNDGAEVKVWHNLSFSHIKLADQLSKFSFEIEKQHENFSSHPDLELVKPYAIGSIMAAVSFLEATINEFLNELLESNEHKKVQFLTVKEWWNKNKRNTRISLLDKYQKSLKLSERQPYNISDEIFTHIKSLIYLRNTIVHFKPEWVPILTDSNESPINIPKLEELLKDKFEMCKFHKYASNPYFPDKCLGYGCTRWAIKTAIDFANNFFDRMKIEPPYNYILKQLTQINLDNN